MCNTHDLLNCTCLQVNRSVCTVEALNKNHVRYRLLFEEMYAFLKAQGFWTPYL